MRAEALLIISLLLFTGFLSLKYFETKRGVFFFDKQRRKLDRFATNLFVRVVDSWRRYENFNMYEKLRFLFFVVLSWILVLTAKISAKMTKVLHISAKKLEHTSKPSKYLKEVKEYKDNLPLNN